jgi:hypothetical protein
MTEDATTPDTAEAPPDMGMAPGGPRALADGCICSVLVNAAYRAGVGEDACVDPRGPLHAEGASAPLT